MLDLDYKESWALKNWCFWTLLDKILKSPFDWNEIQPAHPQINQSWILIGRTYVVAETSIVWPPDEKIWLIWKDPDAGKDWRQYEKGITEGGIIRWHHQLNGLEFGYTQGFGDEQGGLACCSPDSDTIERLNWTELKCVWICMLVAACVCMHKHCGSMYKYISH